MAKKRRRRAPRGSSRQETSTEVNFAEEYAYVYQDLKTIAIIAVVMLGILIALSFVIT